MLTGAFCTALCAAALAIIPNPIPDPSSQGTVTLLGHPVGRYVDDQQPGQCAAVQTELQEGAALVIAGIPPSGGPGCPGAVNVREWYPFDCRYPPGSWGPVPRASAYILQRSFAWPGCRCPTAAQRARLLRAVVRHRPRLVIWY